MDTADPRHLHRGMSNYTFLGFFKKDRALRTNTTKYIPQGSTTQPLERDHSDDTSRKQCPVMKAHRRHIHLGPNYPPGSSKAQPDSGPLFSVFLCAAGSRKGHKEFFSKATGKQLGTPTSSSHCSQGLTGASRHIRSTGL